MYPPGERAAVRALTADTGVKSYRRACSSSKFDQLVSTAMLVVVVLAAMAVEPERGGLLPVGVVGRCLAAF